MIYTDKIKEVATRQLTTKESMNDRVVAGFSNDIDGRAIITFTDSSYIAFEVDGYEMHEIVVSVEFAGIDLLRAAGIISYPEHAAEVDARAAVSRNERLNQERREYEKLKAKFEPSVV